MDGGAQKRAFTYIDDGIDALMQIIENQDGVATGKIYNVGNPSNNFSVRELAEHDAEARARVPGVPRRARSKVQARRDHARARTTARGYQDVQNRVPKIDNTMRELDWQPRVDMEDALKQHLRRLPQPRRRGPPSGRLS